MWVASPDGLRLVQLLFLNLALFDLLGLGLLLFLFILIVYLLDLGLLLLVFLFFFRLFGFGVLIGNVLLSLFQDVKVDGVGDELRMLLDNLLDFALIEIISLLVVSESALPS